MIELEKLNEFTESHGALRTGKGLVSGVIALTLARKVTNSPTWMGCKNITWSTLSVTV